MYKRMPLISAVSSTFEFDAVFTRTWQQSTNMQKARFTHSLVHLAEYNVLLACGGPYGAQSCEFRVAEDVQAEWNLFNVPSEICLNENAGVSHQVLKCFYLCNSQCS